MILDRLAERLEAAGHGEIARSIFVHFMPDDIAEGIMLRTPLNGHEIDHELPGVRTGEIQFIVRARDFTTGFGLITPAVQAITMLETVIADENGDPQYRVNWLRPMHDPIVYPRSMGNAYEFSVNFDCRYVILST